MEEDGFYSIFDEGYLYAASSNGNQLKTKDSLDVNGQWEISIDSVFSIVASHSENRNVMQFNYNGNDPTLFSCYSSANQSPVYLYVKDETTTTVTQTIALVSGFNWISANVEITLDDLKAALVAALPGATITINSQNGGSTTYNGTRWRGSLNSLDLSQMYMIETTAAGEMTLEGMPIVPSEHPANIFVGNNWIAFPLTQSMTLANAFVGFPVNGDQVTSQDNGFSTYNNRWRGTLTTLDPNKGYLYFSASPNDRTLTFPSSK